MRPFRLLLVALVGLATGCARSPRITVAGAGEDHRLATLLAEQPIAAGEPLRAIALGHGDHLSLHVVRIRDREAPHVHARHDLAVTLLDGEGELHLADHVAHMRPGDSAFVPAQVPHYFVNTGRGEAVAIVTFAPPLTAPDTVPARVEE